MKGNCGNDPRVMNQKVCAVKAKLNSAANSLDAYDDDIDNDLFDTETLSQEDLIVQILDSNAKIKKWEKCYQEAAENDMEKSFHAGGNNETGTKNA